LNPIGNDKPVTQVMGACNKDSNEIRGENYSEPRRTRRMFGPEKYRNWGCSKVANKGKLESKYQLIAMRNKKQRKRRG